MKLADTEDVRECAQQGLEQLQEVEGLNYVSQEEELIDAPITIPADTDNLGVNPNDLEQRQSDQDDDEPLTDAQSSENNDKSSSSNFANLSENKEAEQLSQDVNILDPEDEEGISTGFKEFLQRDSDFSDDSDSDETAINNTEEPTSFSAPLSDWDSEASNAKSSSEETTLGADNDNFFDELEFTSEEMAEIAQFDLGDISSELASSDLSQLSSDALSENFVSGDLNTPIIEADNASQEESLDFNSFSPAIIQPTVDGKQGLLKKFNNASLKYKHGIIAVAAGLVPIFVIIIIGFISSVTALR